MSVSDDLKIPSMEEMAELLELGFGSDYQRTVMRLRVDGKNWKEIGQEYGIDFANANRSLRNLKKRAIAEGWALGKGVKVDEGPDIYFHPQKHSMKHFLEGEAQTIPMRTHMMLPDMQVTPDAPTDHLEWIGYYIVEQKPDVIVDIGDFADMESLSTYDRGKRDFEGRRYIKDIDCARRAMERLLGPLNEYNRKCVMTGQPKYTPELHLTLGNHEHRIHRAIEDDARLDGTLGLNDLGYEDFGWKVYPFLSVAILDGIHYSHFFSNPMSGRPYGGQSIDTRLKNVGFSFSQGHQQTLMTGQRFLNNGQRIRGLVAGSCYLHDEDYRGPQSNGEWRGILFKHEVRHGEYDLMEVSLDFLCRRYEGCHVWEFMREKYPEIYDNSTWMRRAALLARE